MSDAAFPKEAKARDKQTLEQQIMDASIPKNDAEWWARGEIERLREERISAQRTLLRMTELAAQYLADNFEPA